MTWRFRIGGVGLALFIVAAASPASAQSYQIVFSDEHVASAIDDLRIRDGACHGGPYALYRQTCVTNELNVSPDRSSYQQLTMLDQLALFVYRYKDLNLRRELTPGTKIHFKAGLSNMYQQEAHLEVRMQVRF